MARKSQQIKFKKAPGAPKRFKSAYMFFHCVLEQIRAAEVAKLVSQAWKDLSDEGRAPWLELGRRDRERYEREKAIYKGPWKVPDIKDPNAPKRPMSAFLAFSNERRRAIVAENPRMSGTEISSVLSKMWREAPLIVKKAYRDREASERETYKKEMAVWKHREEVFSTTASSSTSSVSNNDDSTSEMDHGPFLIAVNHDPLDIDDFEGILSLGENVLGTEKSWLDLLEAITPLDLKRIDTTASVSCTSNSSFNLLPNETWSSAEMPQKIQLPTRESAFENYTLDDILQSDELFEDFSPSQVNKINNSPFPPPTAEPCNQISNEWISPGLFPCWYN